MANKSVWDFTPPSAEQGSLPEKYGRLLLTRNPFPAVGVASENPMFPPLDIVDPQLREVLTNFIQDHGNQIVGIIGDYGTGKTHTLRVIQEKMQESNFPIRPKIVYVASAGYELYSLLRSILDSFGRDEITKTIWRALLDDIRQNVNAGGFKWLLSNFAEPKDSQLLSRPTLLDTGDDDFESSTIPVGFSDEHLSDYRRFLSEYAKRKLSPKRLRAYAISFLTRRLRCSAFLAAELFDATDDDFLKAQSAWDRLTISGEKNAPYKPDQEASVMTVLLTITEMTGNYDSFVLLVDEFEATVSATLQRKQQETYLRALRLLYDVSIERSKIPALIMLAMTIDALKTVSQIYPALAHRITRIDLPLVDKSLAIEVIGNYLESTRLYVGEPVLPLFPLSEEAVDALIDNLPTKSLRLLLVRCQALIEHLANNQTLELPIGADVVRQVSNWINR
jgi:hypothetical protein